MRYIIKGYDEFEGFQTIANRIMRMQILMDVKLCWIKSLRQCANECKRKKELCEIRKMIENMKSERFECSVFCESYAFHVWKIEL